MYVEVSELLVTYSLYVRILGSEVQASKEDCEGKEVFHGFFIVLVSLRSIWKRTPP